MTTKALGLLVAAVIVHSQTGSATELRGGERAWINLGPDRNAYELVHFLDVSEVGTEGVMTRVLNADEDKESDSKKKKQGPAQLGLDCDQGQRNG